MLLKDTLNVENFPYTYDIIKPTPKIPVLSYIKLINIPVPIESVTIVAYLYPKTRTLNKETDFAGSAYWFGINRTEKFCHRCEMIRTNITIDIDEYVNKNMITENNINDYNLVIEGEGRLINKTYLPNELIKDGEVELIVR